MGLMTKEQLRQFIKENNLKSALDPLDVQDALKELFADTLQEMLEAEMDDRLGYAKNDNKNVSVKKKTPSRAREEMRK